MDYICEDLLSEIPTRKRFATDFQQAVEIVYQQKLTMGRKSSVREFIGIVLKNLSNLKDFGIENADHETSLKAEKSEIIDVDSLIHSSFMTKSIQSKICGEC